MDTKKAIEFIESFKDVITSIDIEEGNKNMIEEYNNNICKVIELLQRGEKYKAMWKDFLQIYCWAEVEKNVSVKKVFNDLKQKYFPK